MFFVGGLNCELGLSFRFEFLYYVFFSVKKKKKKKKGYIRKNNLQIEFHCELIHYRPLIKKESSFLTYEDSG